MRRAARTDDNHATVVAGLREMGVSVLSLHAVGMGCPDIAAGWRNRTYLFEIKDPSKPPSARQLNKMQERWHQTWNGQAAVIHSAEEALEIMQRGYVEIREQVS